MNTTTGQSEETDAYADLVSVAQAARDVHKRRNYILEFAIKRGIAVPDGKRIKIPLAELRRQLSRPAPKANHPLVKC